jgi:Aspartate/tyrosine/aromatic aminotransferase
LDETGIGTVPGDAFYSGSSGKDVLRFCFARDISVIQKACSLIIENSFKWGY